MKIDLPEYCVPMPYIFKEGNNKDYDHDYPKDSKQENDECVHWTCSKCGLIVCFEVYS